MNFKNILLIPIAALMVLATITGALAADDWATGVSYSIGDVVTYQGTDYECIQSHTSQAEWNPAAVTSLWKLYTAPSNDGTWQPGVSYAVGDEVMYEDQLYEVRQAHTSQADWIPSAVLALYKPVIKSTVVKYLPPESNYEPSDYIVLSRPELITMMDFEFVQSQKHEDKLTYTWGYFLPQYFNNKIEWVYKPINVDLKFDTIRSCLDTHTEQSCFNGLVLGSENIYKTVDDESVLVESVVTKAYNEAISSVDRAIELQSKVTQDMDTTTFQQTSINFVVE